MKRVLVGADGSPGAANALRWALQLASRHGAEVIVMTGFQVLRRSCLYVRVRVRLDGASDPGRPRVHETGATPPSTVQG